MIRELIASTRKGGYKWRLFELANPGARLYYYVNKADKGVFQGSRKQLEKFLGENDLTFEIPYSPQREEEGKNDE